MAGFVVMKKSRHYTGGPGRGDIVYKTEAEAQRAADEQALTNPVGFVVLPYKPIVCEVCGGEHREERHTPSNV